VKKLKRAFSEISEKAKPGDEQLAATQKFGVISQSQFMKDQDQKLVLALKGTDNFKHLEKNDFVISLRAFEGGIERSSQSGCVSPAYTVLRSKGEVSPDFAARLLKTPEFISQISMTYDGIREGKAIKFKDAGPVPLPIPPVAEQSAITTFIDGVLFKMDSAIASQERMIELLKERRSAIITQAVTKGLDPKAKMKDSGVPWLGSVPAHWEVRPLKSLAWRPGALFIDGDWIESENISDFGIRYLTSGNVGEGFYKEQGAGYISEETFKELNCEEVFPGDILISRLNLPIGRACVVPDLGQRIVTCVDNVILRTKGGYAANYLAYLFSSKTHLENMETLGRGSTMLRVSRSTLGNVRFAFPPCDEQNSIVKHLNVVVSELNSTIASQERMIELLKERRSAIITLAVTGQIDVR
jgi:type I restriction enzyme S subunit